MPTPLYGTTPTKAERREIFSTTQARHGIAEVALHKSLIVHIFQKHRRRTVDLGFVDCLLDDTSKADVDIPAYAFSGRETEKKLLNLLTNHYHEEPSEPAGTPIAELERRLNLIKP